LRALARNEVPLLAAVHGNVVGIGTTLLFHCDLVIAEQGSRFIMPFVDLGLVPEAASSLIMPRLSGRRAAARHILLGEPFDADQALALGIASHVVERGGLQAALEKLVAAILAKPAEALRLTQSLLRHADRDEVIERMELENGHFGERLTSDEVRQAITSFFAARAKR
jgi:enoyl-CoA hydratase/carnithine racemase